MRLVFVHGRAQEDRRQADVLQEWEEALREGIRTAGIQPPPVVDIRLPYYGDALAKAVSGADSSVGVDVLSRGDAGGDAEKTFAAEFLTDIASAAGITDAEIQNHMESEVTEKDLQNWALARATMKAIDAAGFGSTAIDAFTHDVFAYLKKRAVWRPVNDIVSAAFDGTPCVVVGHSLGSVVAYNVIRRCAGASGAKRYVTVGSPLGIRAIRDRLGTLVMPQGVARWFNARDPKDAVALRLLDSTNFGILPSVVNKSDVANDTSNHHGIIGYLSDPQVAEEICAPL